jgi:hypothetical protein
MSSSRTLAEAVDRLVDAFEDRWPAFDLDPRTAWFRALHGAAPADVDAVVLDAVGLDDRPPSPQQLAHRVAHVIAVRLSAGGGPAPRPEWEPDPYVLGIIEDGKRRMAAAADRFRLPSI